MSGRGSPARMRRRLAEYLAAIAMPFLFLPPLAAGAVLARVWRRLRPERRGRQLRLLWAGAPLRSLKTASDALRDAGYVSRTIASARYRTVPDGVFDAVVELPVRLWPGLNALAYTSRAAGFFLRSMFDSDVLHCFFNGGILGRTALARWEWRLWKLSGGRLILFPYGSDAFVYRSLPDTEWARALVATYPRTADEDLRVEHRIAHGCRVADAVVGCIVHDVSLPRVDRHPLLWYPFDSALKPNYTEPGPVLRVAHAANHPAIKGTAALREAVRKLRDEGIAIDLEIVEGQDHPAALEAFARADIVVDQLLFGYALAALEAMALGKPVITGLGDDPLYDGYRARGQLDDTPLIAAGPGSIVDVLRRIALEPQALPEQARRSRAYVEHRHGPLQTVALFEDLYAITG
ncbi:MAG: hypothetical protein WAT70_11465 [Rhizobiaceae bacterium]